MTNNGNSNTFFQDKVAGQVNRQLSIILQRDVQDPRASLVTISEVRVNKDLSVAKIYVTVLDRDKQETADVLNKMSGYLRTQLASRIQLKNTPILKFYPDMVQETSNRIEDLLSQIKSEEDSTENTDSKDNKD